MFEQLPGKLREALNSAPQAQKKRSAPSQLPVSQSQMQQRPPDMSTRSINVSNPSHRSNISPHQQGSLKRPTIAQDSSPPHDQIASVDSEYQRRSQNSYSASNNSPSSSLPSSGAPFGMPNNYVPDLSSMMFPSGDPFAYPNQPMTTLEDGRSIKQENTMDSNAFSQPQSSGPPYSSLNFGSLPYMMQGQQLEFGMQNLNPSMGVSNTEPLTNTMPAQRHEGGGWAQQQRPGATPSGQLYGEDWGGWMNQGYRQYP